MCDFAMCDFAAASAQVAGMTTAEALLADINERVAHINNRACQSMARVLSTEGSTAQPEHARVLLATFTQIKGLELEVVTAVIKHMHNSGGWDRYKLAAFNACLGAAIGNRPTTEEAFNAATVAPEPVVSKPKGTARNGRKAVANAKAKLVAAAKRPAAATVAKRPAAAPAKLDKFNIDAWMEENTSRVEARNDPRRHNFLSRVHHRAIKAGIKAGQGLLGLQGLVRGKAAKIWDSVHNVG